MSVCRPCVVRQESVCRLCEVRCASVIWPFQVRVPSGKGSRHIQRCPSRHASHDRQAHSILPVRNQHPSKRLSVISLLF